jgi:hypothetical protein
LNDELTIYIFWVYYLYVKFIDREKLDIDYKSFPVKYIMKNILLIFLCSFVFTTSLFGQTGEELLVYSLKGNVTVVENNAESPIKVGKVLKPGAIIKTQKAAKMTMVCKQGKPISVTKEGVFPVTKWKDSCLTHNNSVTTKYFQFIWDQLYVRSDDYKKDHPQLETLMTDAPVRGQEEFEIVTNPYLDTILFSGGNFPLTWDVSKKYENQFYFMLSNATTKKKVFADSVRTKGQWLKDIAKYMKPGQKYLWSVSTKLTGPIDGGIVNYVTASNVTKEINKIKKAIVEGEDLAASYFRMAFLLESKHYLYEAWKYYKLAAETEPANSFYVEKFNEFKKQFGLN